jgi:ribosomal protein S27AE
MTKIIEQGKLACPNCGSLEVEKEEEETPTSIFWAILNLFGDPVDRYKCKRCGCVYTR